MLSQSSPFMLLLNILYAHVYKPWLLLISKAFVYGFYSRAPSIWERLVFFNFIYISSLPIKILSKMGLNFFITLIDQKIWPKNENLVFLTGRTDLVIETRHKRSFNRNAFRYSKALFSVAASIWERLVFPIFFWLVRLVFESALY